MNLHKINLILSFFKRYSFKCVVNRLDNVKTNKHFIHRKSMTMRRFRNFCIFCNVILIYNPFTIYFKIFSIKNLSSFDINLIQLKLQKLFYLQRNDYTFFRLMHLSFVMVVTYWQLKLMQKINFQLAQINSQTIRLPIIDF